MRQLILASTSPFRKQLLARLGLPFSVVDPQVDETAQPDEWPDPLVRRLAAAKAGAVAKTAGKSLVIGSDQLAVVEGEILGKPGSHDQAVQQLRRLSGRSATFLTALCLVNTATGTQQLEVVPTEVVFRRLDEAQITNYLYREPAYNCAGSFKSECLGIALLEKMQSDDPTALIGLPLISLVKMLELEGMPVL